MLMILFLLVFSIGPALCISVGIPKFLKVNKIFSSLINVLGSLMFGLFFVAWNIFNVSFAFENPFVGFYLTIILLCIVWSCFNGFSNRKLGDTLKNKSYLMVSMGLNFILIALSSAYLYLWPLGWQAFHNFFEYWGILAVYDFFVQKCDPFI